MPNVFFIRLFFIFKELLGPPWGRLGFLEPKELTGADSAANNFAWGPFWMEVMFRSISVQFVELFFVHFANSVRNNFRSNLGLGPG